MNRSINKIKSLKFDGSLHRSWEAELIEESGSMLFFRGLFDTDIVHPDLGQISKGTESFEYYWTDRWHNVFRFHNPDGTFRNFYCNINMPPVVRENTLQFIDLDLDILVQKNGAPELLDLEEFEANAKMYGYGEEIKSKALQQLDVLIEMISKRDFPFDTVKY